MALKQQLGQYDAAIIDAQQIMAIDPESQDYMYQIIGNLYAKSGRTDLAISSYTTHIKHAKMPQHSPYRAYIERSKLYEKTGKYRLALADLDRAIAIESRKSNYLHYTERAKLRDRLGDKEGAKSDRQTASKLEAEYNREVGDL